MGHMLGDVPALLLVAAVLGGLSYSGGERTTNSGLSVSCLNSGTIQSKRPEGAAPVQECSAEALSSYHWLAIMRSPASAERLNTVDQ